MNATREAHQPILDSLRKAHLDASEDNQETILVVDDEVSVRQMCGRFLRLNGFNVREADDGQDAWETLSLNSDVALIVLDVNMPRVGGVELCQRIRSDPTFRSVPIVMISGRGELDRLAANVGASAWLRKPFRLSELLESVRRFL